MEERTTQKAHFHEMWSSISMLEALLETSPDRALKKGNPKMWRIMWNDASAKIIEYLRGATITAYDEESLSGELLAAERSKLHYEIQKIAKFNAEAGDALWKNSASVSIVATNIRYLVHALRKYLEQERRYMMPRKGAAA
jgi:hypothetical protein